MTQVRLTGRYWDQDTEMNIAKRGDVVEVAREVHDRWYFTDTDERDYFVMKDPVAGFAGELVV